jgi:predicted ATP-binding protein involved in virulence
MKPCECREPHDHRRIVLTGGPGAGKTAVLELIRQYFCSHVKKGKRTMAKQKLIEVTSPKADSGEIQAETTSLSEIPNELIAARAYEKWEARGCPLWENEQDWFAARAELEQERGVPSQPGRAERAASARS